MAGMVVQHNMNALNAYNKLNVNVNGLKKSSEKLSSGYRINRAGDDAAGLAISEKMRSQIRGLSQAKRNSQDGISMIQTFEGAAQETHSILQRMKELASESANGTYDNATDRAAIQLEFNQLNDELNQIADTDFNGTIVLNGGVMADGLRAENGEFNYANRAAQAAEDAAAAPIDIFKANNTTTGNKRFNTVDDINYGQTEAEQLWKDLGLDETVSSVDLTVKVKSVDADTGEVTYELAGATTNKGNAIAADKVTAGFGTVTAVNGNGTAITGNGGFKLSVGGGTDNVNAIFDATKLKAGDTLTLNFTGPATGNVAPTNVGIKDGTLDPKGINFTKNPSATIGDLEDADMTPDIEKALKDLDGAEVTFEVAASGTAPKTKTVTIGGQSVANDGDVLTLSGGGKVYAALNGSKITISTLNAAGTGAGTKIAEIDVGTFDAPAAAVTGVKFAISFDEFSAADTTAKPEVTGKASAEIPETASVSESDSFENATSIMTYAENIILQTGARSKDSVNFTFKYNQDDTADMGNLEPNLNISARADGLATENLSLATQKDANYAIDQIDKAINKVSMVRASFGSIQNRLEHKIENLTTTNENLTEAESTIRDTDMASEMLNYTKYNILQQAAQSMLAQANQQPQSVLQLLG